MRGRSDTQSSAKYLIKKKSSFEILDCQLQSEIHDAQVLQCRRPAASISKSFPAIDILLLL
jgi:hypothetical protein